MHVLQEKCGEYEGNQRHQETKLCAPQLQTYPRAALPLMWDTLMAKGSSSYLVCAMYSRRSDSRRECLGQSRLGVQMRLCARGPDLAADG